MQYFARYDAPAEELLLTADEIGLTGLRFSERRQPIDAPPYADETTLPVFVETARWLDLYFAGQVPDFTPQLHLIGSAFQCAIWALLLEIPHGETVSYGALAKRYRELHGCMCMSAQAVGGAVGRNPVSIIVPCHRVVGANGSLTGYASGIPRKLALLACEGVDIARFTWPK